MKRSGFKKLTYQERLDKAKTKKKVVKKKTKKVTITSLKKKLWDECKRIIRARYGNDGIYHCFTCDKLVEAPHTGHIITSSTCSMEMRYSLDNLRPQCYSCNINKSGNWVEFKKRLGDDYINNLIKRNDQTKGGDYGMWWVEKKLEEYKCIKA